MTKILLVAHFDRFGGTRTYFKNLVRFYGSTEYEVIVGLPQRQLDDDIREVFARLNFGHVLIPPFDHFKLWRWLVNPIGLIREAVMGWRLVRRHSPDIIVVSIGAAGALLGFFMLPIRLLYILHACPERIGRLERLITRLIRPVLMGTDKMILTVSEFGRANIVANWLSHKDYPRVCVIHNTAGATSILEDRQRSGRKHVRVLTLGHVTGYKNPFEWIEVAHEVISQNRDQEVEFVWAGDGDLIEECRQRVENSDSEDRIRFVGVHNDVAALYRESDIYFQPSLVESHGIAVLEAMSFGLPCLVADTGGLPESVENGVTGFVEPPTSPDRFVVRLTELVRDRELRKSLGEKAKKRFNDVFEYPRWEVKMQEIHAALLNRTS